MLHEGPRASWLCHPAALKLDRIPFLLKSPGRNSAALYFLQWLLCDALYRKQFAASEPDRSSRVS